MEKKILAAILFDRDTYDKWERFLTDEDFSDQGNVLYKSIRSYYEQDPDAHAVDVEVLVSRIHRTHPKYGDLFEALLRGLEPVSIPNVFKELIEYKIKRSGEDLGHAILAGKHSSQAVRTYLDLLETKEEDFATRTTVRKGLVFDVFKDSARENLIAIYPRAVNEVLKGGVTRGTHIVVFGRPEVGKTLFTINLIKGFLDQGLVVLFCSNEDPYPKFAPRLIQRISGKTEDEIRQAGDISEDTKRKADNFIHSDLDPGTPSDIESLIKEHKPDVVIVDQIYNLKVGDLEQTAKLSAASQAMRRFCKRYNIVAVSLTQAGDSAHNKVVLDMNDIEYSNTGVQTPVDLMIGIGANAEMLENGRRMLSFPKNKVSAVHAAFPVIFDTTIHKVISA